MIWIDPIAAFAAAEDELRALGFKPGTEPRSWRGRLTPEYDDICLSVVLPPRFPYELPEVLVERSTLPRQIAHVERNGKVCIASSDGLLLDVGRPQALVRDTLKRARSTLTKGLRGESDEDLWTEFSAYWVDKNARDVLSVCEVEGPSRVISFGLVARRAAWTAYAVADGTAQLKALSRRMGLTLDGIEPAWFIRLRAPILPPLFDERTDLRRITEFIREGVGTEQFQEIQRTTYRGQERPTFVFSFSIPNGRGNALFGWRLDKALPSNGYRSGRVPLGLAIGRSGLSGGQRLSIQRADPQFLSARTGSVLTHESKRVAIVGCGAVGGYLAHCLADSGVSKLTLIDHDTLRSENAMRHVLGLEHVGSTKVVAMKRVLQARLPHLEIEAIDETAERVVGRPPNLLLRHDLIIFATGNHVLELGLIEGLRKQKRIVHTWVEAHGVGGHVLVDGGDAGGCLSCLLVEDEVHGLRSPASFFEPGQDFSQSMGGCAGTFTPFGSMDAQRAAIEAARVALRVLSGEVRSSVLVSWFEGGGAAHRSGLRLSQRASLFLPGQRAEVTSHAGCPRCAL